MNSIRVGKSLGAALLAQFLSSIVFGVSLLQLWRYFTRFSAKDGWFLKTYVAVISILNAFHAFLCYHYIYVYLVIDPNPIFYPAIDIPLSWSEATSIVAGAPQVFLIQIYFAYRVYVYSNRKLWPVFVIVTLSFCQLAACMAATVYQFDAKARKSAVFSVRATYADYAALSADIAANALIALLSTFYLRKMQKKSASRGTLRIVQMLVVYSIRTCLLITLFAFTAIFMIAFTKSSYSLVFYNTALRLYVCSLLSILNGREELWVKRNVESKPIEFKLVATRNSIQDSKDKARTQHGV